MNFSDICSLYICFTMYRELRLLLLTAALAVFIIGYLPAKQGKSCGCPHGHITSS